MSPYLSVALAMCAIVVIALALTAYMAVIFNRRAKADLEQALTPLASIIHGKVELDDAKISGRFAGHIVEGQMATSLAGPGRVFHTSVFDGAGGHKWTWTRSRPKRPAETSRSAFESPAAELAEALIGELDRLLVTVSEPSHWTIVEYDPVPGHVRLTRPMQTRRDIPGVDQFESDLSALVTVAAVNRAAQYAEA